MHNSISLLFYIKKSKADSFGNCNIYLRITINQRRSEFSILRKIQHARWSNNKGLAIGSSKEIQELNRYISAIKSKIYQLQESFLEKGESVTAIKLRDAFLEKDTNTKMLLEVFKSLNEQIEKLIGIDFATNTLVQYKTTLNHITNYECYYNLSVWTGLKSLYYSGNKIEFGTLPIA